VRWPSAAGRTRPGALWPLHIGVAGAEHGREPGGFLFAPAAFARFLKMPMVAHDFQSPFAVDFFLQPPQGFLNRLALFKLNFGQNSLTSSRQSREMRRP